MTGGAQPTPPSDGDSGMARPASGGGCGDDSAHETDRAADSDRAAVARHVTDESGVTGGSVASGGGVAGARGGARVARLNPEAGLWNVANLLTMTRLVLVPGFVLLLVHDNGDDPAWRSFAWAAFAVAMITDLFDGELARRYGLVTDFGKIADPIADKAIMGAALVGLSALGDLPWWVTGVILFRELGITLMRFWVIRHGVIPASRGGKLKTLTQGVAVGMYVLVLTGPLASIRAWIMAVAVVLTVATGVDYVRQAVVLRRAGLAAQAAARERRAGGAVGSGAGSGAEAGSGTGVEVRPGNDGEVGAGSEARAADGRAARVRSGGARRADLSGGAGSGTGSGAGNGRGHGGGDEAGPAATGHEPVAAPTPGHGTVPPTDAERERRQGV